LTGLAVGIFFPAFSPRDNEKQGKSAVMTGLSEMPSDVVLYRFSLEVT
jgi:hypothetical protein